MQQYLPGAMKDEPAFVAKDDVVGLNADWAVRLRRWRHR